MTWEVQYPNLELEPPSPFPALDTSLILYGSTAKLEVEVVLRDPEVVLGDPEVVLGDLEVVLRDPEVGLGDLEVVLRDPEVGLGDPSRASVSLPV